MPIAGVLAGLRAAATETAVFLPVDCPLVTPDLLRQLGEAVAVPQTGPLPGGYAKADVPELERAWPPATTRCGGSIRACSRSTRRCSRT